MKKLIFLAVVLAIAAVVGGVYLLRDSFDVYLTEAQLQERVDEAFPEERRHLALARVVLSEPRVNLFEGSDRIHFGLRARVSVTGVGEVLDGSGTISGTIRYEPDEAAFFFDDIRIEELDTGDLSQRYEEPVREGAAVAAREALRRQPVYRLQDDDLRQAAARLILRDVRVVDGRLRIRLGMEVGGGG